MNYSYIIHISTIPHHHIEEGDTKKHPTTKSPKHHLLNTKTLLHLTPPPLQLLNLQFLLQLLPSPNSLLTNTLNTLNPLPFLIHRPRFQYPLNNLPSIHVLKIMLWYFFEDFEVSGVGVWVVLGWHEGGGAVVDYAWLAVGEGGEVGGCWCEGGAEDEGVDVLVVVLV